MQKISKEDKQNPNKPRKVEIVEDDFCNDYHMFYLCSKCGSRLNEGMNYCYNCGQIVDWGTKQIDKYN